jgi:hypothetical protein
MAGPTVFEDVADEFALDGVGQLFTGKRFWVAQRVPGRVKLLDDIKANGGEVVLLEKKADYRIADRFRKDCPPGTISYEFITKSIADGRLHDPEDHPAGPPEGEARMTGDLHRPGKGTRTTYTPEEDRICYKWVRDCVAGGGMASGNEIYKQLEAKVCACQSPSRGSELTMTVSATSMAIMARSLYQATTRSAAFCLQHTRQCSTVPTLRQPNRTGTASYGGD